MAVGQAPFPSQVAGSVCMLPVQLSFRQAVAFDHGWQWPAPSQVPLLLQLPAAASLAWQRAFGSAFPAATLVQVPAGTVPTPLQVLHKPPRTASLQAVLQHTPSVQNPLWHCCALVQAAPFTLRPQDPFTHVLGGVQSCASVAAVQLLLHAAFWQAKAPHDWLAGVTQVPAPSQVEAGVTDDEVAQTAGLQRIPLSCTAQVPPRHTPVMPHGNEGLAAHVL